MLFSGFFVFNRALVLKVCLTDKLPGKLSLCAGLYGEVN